MEDIKVDIEPVNPKLDPSSPEFDFRAWKEAVQLNKQAESLIRGAENLKRLFAQLVQLTTSFQDYSEGIKQSLQKSIRPLAEAIKEMLPAMEEFYALEPYILEELRKPEYRGLTIADIIEESCDSEGETIEGSLWDQALNAAIEAREADRKKGIANPIQPISPAYHTMPNNALMNILMQPSINAGAFDMPVINAKGKRKETTAYTMIELDTLPIVGDRLTEYERQVSDAIISLWIEANNKNMPPVIYPEMVYRAMPGGSGKASPQQKGAITKTIEKFRRLHVKVDATDEFRKRKIIEDDETMVFDDFYITARHVEKAKTKNGNKTIENAYLLTSEPIIYSYCKLTKQFLTVPSKLLEIKKVTNYNGKIITTNQLVPMTPQRQAITGYLLRRIAVMYRDNEAAKQKKRSYDRKRKTDKTLEDKPISSFREQSHTILFETLFEDVGLTGQTKQEAYNQREFVYQVLDFFVQNDKRVKGYKEQKKGRAITGVQIIFDTQDVQE